MTWNGTAITGPVLIYLDEILVDSHNTTDIDDPNRSGALICRSDDRARVSWQFTDGTFVTTAPTTSRTTFIQIRTGEGVIPSVSRLSLNRESITRNDGEVNGELHCGLNADHSQSAAIYREVQVGIYSRGGGKMYTSAVGLVFNRSLLTFFFVAYSNTTVLLE